MNVCVRDIDSERRIHQGLIHPLQTFLFRAAKKASAQRRALHAFYASCVSALGSFVSSRVENEMRNAAREVGHWLFALFVNTVRLLMARQFTRALLQRLLKFVVDLQRGHQKRVFNKD